MLTIKANTHYWCSIETNALFSLFLGDFCTGTE